jgi:hypothetical protein
MFNASPVLELVVSKGGFMANSSFQRTMPPDASIINHVISSWKFSSLLAFSMLQYVTHDYVPNARCDYVHNKSAITSYMSGKYG